MSRIHEYLPETLKDVIDLRLLNEDLDIELEQLDGYITGIGKEVIVKSASLYGIQKWEKALGITPKDGDSLETRRFRVNNLLTSKLPYTYRWLIKKLTQITGSPSGYTLNINQADYAITIVLSGLDTNMMIEVQKQLRNAIPSNMVLEIGGPPLVSADIKVGTALRIGTKYKIDSAYDSDEIAGNLIKTIVRGTINAQNGSIDTITYPDRSKTVANIMKVIPGKTYKFTNNINQPFDRIAIYGGPTEDTFISRSATLRVNEYTVPSGVHYIRFNIWGEVDEINNLDDSSCVFKIKEG